MEVVVIQTSNLPPRGLKVSVLFVPSFSCLFQTFLGRSVPIVSAFHVPASNFTSAINIKRLPSSAPPLAGLISFLLSPTAKPVLFCSPSSPSDLSFPSREDCSESPLSSPFVGYIMPKPSRSNRHISTDRTDPYATSTSLRRTAMDAPNPTPAGAAERSSASPWTEGEDLILMEARQKGLNWALIASKHFPSKTSNACRKRHERLMDKRKSQENWDVEALAREYMEVREKMWQILAKRLSQNWQAVEGKVLLVSFSPCAALACFIVVYLMYTPSSCQCRRGLETGFKWGGSCNERICWLYPRHMCMIVAQPLAPGINRSSARPVHWLIRAPTGPFLAVHGERPEDSAKRQPDRGPTGQGRAGSPGRVRRRQLSRRRPLSAPPSPP